MKKEKLDKKLLLLNVKRLWQYMKSDKKYIAFYVIAILVQTGLGIILPLISARVILYLTDGLFQELLLTSIVILIIRCVDTIFDYFKSCCNEHLEKNTTNRLQVDFAREFLKLETSEIDRASTGTFIERINHDTSGMGNIFFRLSFEISSVLSKLGTLVTIFILNKIFFIYFMIIALISFFFDNIRNKIQEKYWKKIREAREEKTSLISELVRGARDIKVLNATNNVMQKTNESISRVTDESFKSDRFSSRFSAFRVFVSDITDFLFLALGVILCKNNKLTISVFLILYNYRGSISHLFLSISSVTNTFRAFNVSAKKVFEVIYSEGYEKEKFGNKHLKKFAGNLEFIDVSFSYDDVTNVIKNMSFKIKPNKTYGFVGKSGAGKSTIFSLITKLYSTSNGQILFDGVNINELDEASIRDNISIINQNPYIFNFSIRENLLLANPKASMKEIREACKLACIDDYIMGLPQKYETKLGENGLILSGGQKQRIAIARALLLKTEIILFDEATSALDNETQSSIQDAIHNLKGEYTILIIAHRLSTVVDSDKIFVIDKGKIVGEGNHEELMNENKVYQRLYKSKNT